MEVTGGSAKVIFLRAFLAVCLWPLLSDPLTHHGNPESPRFPMQRRPLWADSLTHCGNPSPLDQTTAYVWVVFGWHYCFCIRK